MIFKEGTALYTSEIERNEGEAVLYVNYLNAPFVPSIAENSSDMSRVVGLLEENPQISRVVFVQQRNYSYNSEQISLLSEIASLHTYLTKKEDILSVRKLNMYGSVSDVYNDLNYLLMLLQQDPLFCYAELKNRIKQLKGQLNDGEVNNVSGLHSYIRLLEHFFDLVKETKLVKSCLTELGAYSGKSRELYKKVFKPDILPNFTFTRLVAHLPENAELIDQYEIKGDFERATVTILKKEGDSKFIYHIMPPEYSLSEEHHMLLNLARNVLIEHRPKAEEFTDPEKTRNIFFNVAKDLLGELSKNRNVDLSYDELQVLSRILVRYTIGYGLIEILLLDREIQDIVLNAPIAQNPIYVRHGKHDECVTNIIPSYQDADSWAAKLRLQSGRPLDEANPVLDSDLVFGGIRARIAAIKEPLSPAGLAYALRRHRDDPWTLPLFIKNKMMNSFAAGLLSFFIDGNRSLIVAGTRSSGKTSLLGSLMLEILSKVRIITVEDTLELSVDAMRKLGYDILRMKVRSALVSGGNEIEASEGIRTSLRLGDSALIVGEIRSLEAKSLYEAMRVGALANVVAGTIHGDSPYGVYDRVVNDLEVPKTSFKATDIIIVTNPVRSADGLRSVRRIVSVSEVRKHWTTDPLEEGGFVDLLKYNVETDELEPTPDLINGDSQIIKNIASNVKGWAGNWDAVYDNIVLRGMIKQEIVDFAEKLKRPDLLEAKFCVLANNMFHSISAEVREEYGLPLKEYVFPRWKKWIGKFVGG
ncbi:hypothetical protein COU54_04595 [Candidatus Pacearchaeota archaeon CG10_big_fil_rev_8_21_14_0_10_31_24]|nr:MAG: hypothetical protein COU54_04595 [Candidatus Pacearchaeota archaeon CG10_big_fil_rev_8_21_14_0_10_31_24]